MKIKQIMKIVFEPSHKVVLDLSEELITETE